MCTHKETLDDEVYEIHYGCSRFLPPGPEGASRHCVVYAQRRVVGPAAILIKRIFICVLLICTAEAIGEKGGGEMRWEKMNDSN